MTRETYTKACQLDHDLTILKDINFELNNNHWIGFRAPNNKEFDSLWLSELRNDFKEFITTEIVKANIMFEDLR